MLAAAVVNWGRSLNIDSGASALKTLTHKQMKFVRELVNGKSQADAYRAAYDTSRMNANSIRREASRLMENPNIATMVERLQRKADTAVIKKRVATREEVLETITQFMMSGRTGDSVKLRAAELMGKHYGLFTDKVVTESKYQSPEEIEKALVERLSAWTGAPVPDQDEETH